MEIPFFIALFLLLAAILLGGLLAVLLHELGHAIPVLFMTKGNVQVYIGSFGKVQKSVKCRLGRLEIYCRINPFSWLYGACLPPLEPFSINQQLFYISMGPLVSGCLAVASWYLLASQDMHASLKLLAGGTLVLSFFHLLGSIPPRKLSSYTLSGVRIYNDGYWILYLLKSKRYPKTYQQAMDRLQQSDFEGAAQLAEKLLAEGYKDRAIYQLAIYACIYTKSYQRGLAIYQQMADRYRPDADDYCNYATLELYNDNLEQALRMFQQSLYLQPNNIYAFNGMGYLLGMQDKHEEAIDYLDKSIALSPQFAYAYNNRGYSRIKLGALDEGFRDISYSLQLDDKNAYAHRNLGIYYFLINKPEAAVPLLEKAKALDDGMPLLDDYLTKVKDIMQQDSNH